MGEERVGAAGAGHGAGPGPDIDEQASATGSAPDPDELDPGRVDAHMATGEEPEADVIEQSLAVEQEQLHVRPARPEEAAEADVLEQSIIEIRDDQER